MSDATTPTRPHEGTPLPRPTPLSQPHWDGCREGELRVQRCTACGALEFIPQPVCTACFTEALEWTRVSGRGEVYSFSVVHRPQRPEFRAPYVVAIVALEEGAHMLTNLVDVAPDDVRIGMPVEVAFHRASDAITLPYFRPRAAPAAGAR
ncbi:MAG: Zn-ribbon domain-containing OB-fold protein [Myxococcota bacterium]|nr:Zn-ribbon domain-containing OB-fold protein [Myxococcales bacterium]